eukprot:g10836.t1
MPGYEDRASILQGAGAMIFNMVCELSTPEQWAEWLRVPLEHAVGTGNADLVGKLLKAGAGVSSRWKGCNGQTLLHAGAEGGDEHVLSALIRAGAKDVNTQAGANRRTPLHLAALGGKVAAAKVLMLGGADVNILDAANESPLHIAVRGGNAGLAEIFLLRGADPNLRDHEGFYPIHVAAIHGQDELVRTLVNTGVQIDCLDGGGRTPLYLAVRQNHLPTVKVLLDGGADGGICCRHLTPLHKAAYNDNAEMVAAFAGAGVDIDVRNARKQTPLHLSALYGTCSTMLALLRLGADVHAKTIANEYTPLNLACWRGHLEAADLLLSWGSDETATDKQGNAPSARIPNIADASEQNRPRLERLSRLLASAPQHRAWRRRGMLVMCRAHPDRVRLAVEMPDTAEAIGQPQQRPIRGARRGEVEVTMSGPKNEGAGRPVSSAGCGRRATREGSGGGDGGGCDGVATWLMSLTNEDVFRNIVRFL